MEGGAGVRGVLHRILARDCVHRMVCCQDFAMRQWL